MKQHLKTFAIVAAAAFVAEKYVRPQTDKLLPGAVAPYASPITVGAVAALALHFAK